MTQTQNDPHVGSEPRFRRRVRPRTRPGHPEDTRANVLKRGTLLSTVLLVWTMAADNFGPRAAGLWTEAFSGRVQ
jgi:hypothetical protein